MDEDDSDVKKELSKEVSDYLDQPITRLELVQMVQPLRSMILPIFQAAMNSLVILVNESADSENKEKAKKSFEELNEIFQYIQLFDDRIDNIFEAKPTWTPRPKDSDNE